MENLKIKVNSEAESKEAQELFFELGYEWHVSGKSVSYLESSVNDEFEYLVAWKPGCFSKYIIQMGCGKEDAKEITLPELRDLVILKRNDVGDATHTDGHYSFYVGKDKNYFFSSCDKAWRGTWKNVEILKPIEKPMKEYLRKNSDGTYSYIGTVRPEHVSDFMIEIPEGAEVYVQYTESETDNTFFLKKIGDNYYFANKESEYEWEWYAAELRGHEFILWQRPSTPEELPFIDDEPSLNDQYAEIEKVRQHNHYFKDVSSLNEIDVYMVLKLFNVTDPCLQHIAKKALCAGRRRHKNFNRDLRDILDTAKRAVEINNG